MKGSITGSILGSAFTDISHYEKHFPLIFTQGHPTDDILMTLALKYWLRNDYGKKSKSRFDFYLKEVCFAYLDNPDSNIIFFPEMKRWINCETYSTITKSLVTAPAISSPIGYFAKTPQECVNLVNETVGLIFESKDAKNTSIEVAKLIVLIRSLKDMRQTLTKKDIREHLKKDGFSLDKNVDAWRDENWKRSEHDAKRCFEMAMVCFLESIDFEDCIRNCISIGGDRDSVASIAGGIAEAYYGTNETLWNSAKEQLITLYLPGGIK